MVLDGEREQLAERRLCVRLQHRAVRTEEQVRAESRRDLLGRALDLEQAGVRRTDGLGEREGGEVAGPGNELAAALVDVQPPKFLQLRRADVVEAGGGCHGVDPPVLTCRDQALTGEPC